MSARYVLRYTTQTKNGKEHPCYGLMENRRVTGGRMVQRHAVYLGRDQRPASGNLAPDHRDA
jgi:hypothetical protein